MKKFSFLLAVLCLVGIFAGCGNANRASSTPPQTSEAVVPSAPAAGASSVVASSAAQSKLAPHTRILPDNFFRDLGEYVIYFGNPIFMRYMLESGSDLSAEDNGMWPFWYIVWLEELAANNNAPTRFNIPQYATEPGVSYAIPADVMQQAIQAWYGVEYDVTQVYIDWGDMVPAGYDAESGLFVVTIDGVGMSGPHTTEAPRVEVQEDNTVLGRVDVMTRETDPPTYVATGSIHIRENDDHTYTLLAIEGFDLNG